MKPITADTWTQNTTILPLSSLLGHAGVYLVKLYIINGWGGPSNISSSTDFDTWDNTLNGGADNGRMAFGMAISSKMMYCWHRNQWRDAFTQQRHFPIYHRNSKGWK